jgi:hypothetical protein
MDTKFVALCSIFGFILGMYTYLLIDQGHGCTVEIQRGNQTHVHIGKSI